MLEPLSRYYPNGPRPPLTYHDWSYPSSIWWHSLGAAEQAAWVIVWATAIVGLLAAIGSFAAAWAAQSAARTAIEISTADREERKAANARREYVGNWRAALSLQPSMAHLVNLSEDAIDAFEVLKPLVDQPNRDWPVFFDEKGEFGFSPSIFATKDFARIGELTHLAESVSGSFGTVVLQSLAWSREASSLLDSMIREEVFPKRTTYCVDAYYVDDALVACIEVRKLAQRALDMMVDIAGPLSKFEADEDGAKGAMESNEFGEDETADDVDTDRA